MPPSSTAPLRDPASSRTAERPSFTQGEESCARACGPTDNTITAAAKPARMGTMTVMKRLYRQAARQTIELLGIHGGWARSLIDSGGTRYQDKPRHESPAMDLTRKKPAGGRGKAADPGEDESGQGYLDGQMLIAMPVMEDPRFAQSVIYLCAHSSEGAMGIIVNRPAGSIDFPELLVQLDIIKKADQIKLPENAETMKVLKGGPVETGRGFVTRSS